MLSRALATRFRMTCKLPRSHVIRRSYQGPRGAGIGRARATLIAGIATSLLAGCASGGSVAPDAGSSDNSNRRLVLLPEQEIGLTYSSRAALRVRYETATGERLAGEEVRYSLVADNPGEDTAGATLSAATGFTGADGVAGVDVVTGAQEARFRISVNASDAPTQHFYVSVSQGGFARLRVTPIHAGWRPQERFERIEVRLYASSLVPCAALDLGSVDEPPPSAYPVREVDGFGDAVELQNISAGQAHTVVAWARLPGSAVGVAAGCMDLDQAQLPASRVQLELLLEDLDLRVPADAPLVTSMDLSLVAAAVAQAGATRAWEALACPAGPGQLLLDCTLDAAAPDDALDCVPGGTSSQVTAVQARRGPLDAQGCRPDLDADGAPSLDRVLTDAVEAGGTWPVGDALAALVQVRADVLASFELASSVTPVTAGAFGHRLTAVRVRGGDQVYELDVGATSRPVIEQPLVPVVLEDNRLDLSEHGFTLRYGTIAAAALVALGLEPAGLPPDAAALGRALVASVTDTVGGTSGCEALSNLVCDAIGGAPPCLVQACQDATPAMDDALAAWWRAVQGTGLDLDLAGSGLLHDDDGDLVVERIGRDAEGMATGLWNGRMTLADGTRVPVLGVF